MANGKATADEILARAAATLADGRRAYRDVRLDAGKLLHEYILAFLTPSDGMTDRRRYAAGVTREKAVANAAAALEVGVGKVALLLQVAATVDLLSGGAGVGRLSWEALRYFAAVVYRRGSHKCQNPDNRGKAVSDSEAWAVKKSCEPWARDLFREAVAGAWKVSAVRDAVRERRGGAGRCPGVAPPPSQCRPRRKPRTPSARHGENPVEALRQSAAAASDGDLVELLVGLAEKAQDPVAVAERVLERLKASRGKKRASLYATAEAGD